MREGEEALQVIADQEIRALAIHWVVTAEGIYFYQLSDSEDIARVFQFQRRLGA